jgi:hypothetical protein
MLGTDSPAQAERQALQRRIGLRGLFQNRHGTPCRRQFAGEERADGAGAGDDRVVVW